MRKKIKQIVLLLALMLTTNISMAKGTKPFNWDRVITAIIQVESEGKVNAVNGGCVGPMQISKICVDEVNKILGKKKYSYQDRKNVSKSKEIFKVLQEQYNPEHNIEKAIRMWNGGPHYKVKNTNNYYRKVMTEYNKKRKE